MDAEKENKKLKPEDIKLRNELFGSAVSGLLATGQKDDETLYNKAFEIAVKSVIYLKNDKSENFFDKLGKFGFKV